jgi:hypothetical protein
MRRMLIDPKHENLLREAVLHLRQAYALVAEIADAERGDVQGVLHSMMKRISSADMALDKLRRRRPPKLDGGLRSFLAVEKWGGPPPPWLDDVAEKARLTVLSKRDDEPPEPPTPPPPPED